MGAEGVRYGGGGKAKGGERKSAMGGREDQKWGGGYGAKGRRMPENLQANKCYSDRCDLLQSWRSTSLLCFCRNSISCAVNVVMEIDLTLCGGFSPRLWAVEVYVSLRTQKNTATLMKLYKRADKGS